MCMPEKLTYIFKKSFCRTFSNIREGLSSELIDLVEPIWLNLIHDTSFSIPPAHLQSHLVLHLAGTKDGERVRPCHISPAANDFLALQRDRCSSEGDFGPNTL